MIAAAIHRSGDNKALINFAIGSSFSSSLATAL
jgi:hypothetical protein